MHKLNPQEVAVTELIHSKAILSLVLKDVEPGETQEAIEAVNCALERALAALLEVDHA
ncbi:hypothetical protein [Rahnella sp. CJA17(1/100)]|uniref:hypothetical protein n=1 Tax=Rahnella sp. CJA17(1/100) TaxID=2508951 RepID=UPI00143191A6|nr:hypothetical protein [Rahnella sp. CJA17(1/100)]